MSTQTMTLQERERLAYIENHPDKELLGELVDAEHELDEAHWRLEELR
jgi:hypothetical protein